MQGAVRRVTTTAALANAEGPLGAWAMGLHGFLAEVRSGGHVGDKTSSMLWKRWLPLVHMHAQQSRPLHFFHAVMPCRQ